MISSADFESLGILDILLFLRFPVGIFLVNNSINYRWKIQFRLKETELLEHLLEYV